jgi:hypothetical protein
MKMKRAIIYLIVTIFYCSSVYAQKLTITDLITLCSKKNWEEVNKTLQIKGWEYHESSTESGLSVITWSYKKSYYDDKALGWFYLYTDNGFIDKVYSVAYTVHNQESYSIIQNSIETTGYKLIDSEIENNKLISTYENSKYYLIISTIKTTREDSKSSITTYNIELVKKEYLK